MNAACAFCITAAAALALSSGRPAVADVPLPPADFDATTESDGLAGTVWTGNDGPVAAVVVFHFEASGVLSYSYNGVSFRDGTWEQSGNSLHFEMTKKFRECRATVRGSRIDGNSWNVNGSKWTTTMRRTKSAP